MKLVPAIVAKWAKASLKRRTTRSTQAKQTITMKTTLPSKLLRCSSTTNSSTVLTSLIISLILWATSTNKLSEVTGAADCDKSFASGVVENAEIFEDMSLITDSVEIPKYDESNFFKITNILNELNLNIYNTKFPICPPCAWNVSWFLRIIIEIGEEQLWVWIVCVYARASQWSSVTLHSRSCIPSKESPFLLSFLLISIIMNLKITT